MAANVPWGNAIGPLALPARHELSRGSIKILSKFNGDGKTSLDDHISAFFTACVVLLVEYEDVAIRLFIETLHDIITDWFHYLPNGCITSWDDMKTKFENRFKTAEDEHALLAQVSQAKKEPTEPMRNFVAKFNKMVNKVLAGIHPNLDGQKYFFIKAHQPEVCYQLRRASVATLELAQSLAIEIEDDLIMAGKFKKNSLKGKSQETLNALETILTKITGAPTRLAIEAAPATNSKCDVIEESDDEIEVVEIDEEDPDSETSETAVEDLEEESNNHLFEYRSDEEDEYEEIIEDMNSQSFAIFTRSQKKDQDTTKAGDKEVSKETLKGSKIKEAPKEFKDTEVFKGQDYLKERRAFARSISY
ncbi:hypothetical protein KI387_044116 [Taxus chinensis]|uniref:Retrotransposon gag domain-containing protein n=1 Tax=Taxus chinensis TaxID=29808 RepID=A0AA38CJP1_TAXCH|nr:hypothetical protein KI387_044116 [Taxus chinensis]